MRTQPRDFNQLLDFSDRVFFQAYADDIKQIATSLRFRQFLEGQDDPSSTAVPSHELDPGCFGSTQEYEQALANEIDYLVALIRRKSCTQHQDKVHHAILNSGSLTEMRAALTGIVREYKLALKKDKKQAFDPDSKETKQPLLPLLRPTTVTNPCLGALVVGRQPKTASPGCVALTFEDFDKLVMSAKGFVPAFIEDLLQYLTIGMVSARAIETYLGPLREEPEGVDFGSFCSAATFQEFLVQKKLTQMNQPWDTSEPEVPTELVDREVVNNGFFDFRAQFHLISQPYTVKDQELPIGTHI